MKQHYCDFRLVNETSDGILSVCKECKKRSATKKDIRNGRIDNKKYIKENVRAMAQPHGKTRHIFERYYGEAPKDLRFK